MGEGGREKGGNTRDKREGVGRNKVGKEGEGDSERFGGEQEKEKGTEIDKGRERLRQCEGKE